MQTLQTGALLFVSIFSIAVPVGREGLWALPQNPLVIEGDIRLQSQEQQLSINVTDRSIIHWDDFSIGLNEKVSFTLPSAHSAVLNRVCGESPSALLGQLHSNGAVYLINPHGILIGKEGVIQTASFIASTLDVSNFDFLEGKALLFQGDSEHCIENYGTITAESGPIVLLAQQIVNEGNLLAPEGMILIGAGREITYLPYGNDKIQISLKPQEKTGEEPIGILQKGLLQAKGIELKADGNLYGYAIKNEGIIEATGVEDRGGHIYLVAEQGHTNHSGLLKGDDVRILGKCVTIIDKAKIDVSSPTGGGVILIGGDYQGQNPEIFNADFTLVEEGVTLCADALKNGNGGKVIVWGNEATGFYGNVSARGGEHGGDGGFIEVSGKDLDYRGMANTLAPQGHNGLLFLDPTDITITDAATSAGIVFGGACGVTTYCNTGALSPRNIQYGPVGTPGTILANLVLGNVTVASTPGGPAGGNGDITFSATAVSGNWTGVNTNTFTLNARRNITFTTNFTNSTTAGNFTCNAGLGVLGVVTVNAGITLAHSSAGTLTLNSNTTAGSDITINGILNVTGGNLTILLNDDFILAASPAAMTFNSPGNTCLFTTTAAAGSVVTFNGPVTINGNSTWTTSGTLTFNDGLTTSGSGTLAINSVGTVTTGAASVVNYNSTGNLTVTVTGATNDIVINGTFNIPSANATFTPRDDFTLAATTGIITFSAAGKTLTFNPGSSTTYNFNGALNVTGGNLFIQAFDDINIALTTGSITYNVPGGSCSFTSTGGANPGFNINGALTITNGTLTANTFDNIVIGGSGSFTYNSSATSTLTGFGTAGNITINGLMTVTDGSIIMNSTSTITSAAASSITWSSPGTWSMTTTGTNIVFAGPVTVSNGTVIMTANNAITLGAASTLTWSSPGSLTMMNVTPAVGSTVALNGIMNFTNGTWSINSQGAISAGGASTLTWSSPGSLTMMNVVPAIGSTLALNGLTNFTNGSWSIDVQGSISTAGASMLNYSAPNPFPMLTHLGNITFNGPVHLNTVGAFSAIASVGTFAINQSVTNLSSGPITATSGGNFTINSVVAVIPSIIGSAGGLTTINVGGALTLNASEFTAGSDATIGFSSGGLQGDIIIDVAAGCIISARGNQNATIRSTGKLTMTEKDGLILSSTFIGGQLGKASISANGDLSITAEDISLLGVEGAPVTSIMSSQGNMKLITFNSITVADNCLISNQGSGNLTIVVDENAPLPPQIGAGEFKLLGRGNIMTNGGELSIFTATPSQNQINGLINGATLAQGIQVFGTYFQLSGIDPPPFTIFYKTGTAGNSFFDLVVASAEMTQQQMDRAMGWAWMSPFIICYDAVINSCADAKFSRRYMLFKRKPFEYPIFFEPVECPDKDMRPIAHDPFRYLY